MTATVLRRPAYPHSFSERAWTIVSLILTKLSDANIRTGTVVPFGL
jgi:hypothetical protein